MDTHAPQSQIGRWCPGRSRLAVADRGGPEDPRDIFEAAPLTPFELVGPFQKPEALEGHGRQQRNAVPVGMIPDDVFQAPNLLRVRHRCSSTRAFSPTTLKVPWTPSDVRSFAIRSAASLRIGSM